MEYVKVDEFNFKSIEVVPEVVVPQTTKEEIFSIVEINRQISGLIQNKNQYLEQINEVDSKIADLQALVNIARGIGVEMPLE